jgi:endogenous inhibitor of DNA gyrase (YacG/DUF329 family)
MASTTYNHRKGSTFRAAMKRSAEARQCPECGRKSALSHYSDETHFGSVCRWCDFARLYDREEVLRGACPE